MAWYAAGTLTVLWAQSNRLYCPKWRMSTASSVSSADRPSAMALPTAFLAQGNWSRARNRFPNRKDGGNPSGSGALIG